MPGRPRALAALSLLLSWAALTACGGAPAPEPDPAVSAVTADPALQEQLPERFKAAGKIVFAIQQHPPYTVLTGDQGSGPNEDLQNAIAAKLGLEAETAVVGGGLGPVLTGLSANRYDAAMGPAEVTEERIAQYDLVGYLKAGQGYVVDKEATPGEDILVLCGQPISFIQGGTIDVFVANLAEYCTANGKPPVTPLPLADTSKAILAVKSGRAAAAGMGSASALYAVSQDGSMGMIPQSVEAGGNYHNSAIVLPKDSGLAPLVVEALRDLMADGTYQGIITKYGLGDSMVDEPTLNPPPEATPHE